MDYVPTHVLLLLRNLTKGKEECIFTTIGRATRGTSYCLLLGISVINIRRCLRV